MVEGVGSSLLFSVGGTLLIMLIWGVGLNRTSLAAFIIAMGMLVDNAIVVTDNAQVGIKRGLPFLAPALCGCALMTVESSDRFSISASSFKD